MIPIITIFLGWFQGIPWIYVFVGAVFAFASISHGLLRFAEWQFQRSPQDKISFVSASVSRVPDDKNLKSTRAIKIGFVIASKALFPIEIEIAELRTQFMDRVSEYPKPQNIIRTIGMGSMFVLHDRAIELSGINLKNLVANGLVELTLKYGTPGKRHHELKHRAMVELFFSEEGNFRNYNSFDSHEESVDSLN